jgi:hypothetical protein
MQQLLAHRDMQEEVFTAACLTGIELVHVEGVVPAIPVAARIAHSKLQIDVTVCCTPSLPMHCHLLSGSCSNKMAGKLCSTSSSIAQLKLYKARYFYALVLHCASLGSA